MEAIAAEAGDARERRHQNRSKLIAEADAAGPDSPPSLVVRAKQSEANLFAGRLAATEATLTLPDLFDRVVGRAEPAMFFAKYCRAQLLLDLGRAADAEAELRDLLPLREKAQGPEHPLTLATRRALARAALEQAAADPAAADMAREALASLPPDGDDPDPLRMGQTAMLRGWLADLDGDAARAEELLEAAARHLAHLTPEHHARRELDCYRKTRVPGGTGGTTLWAPRAQEADGTAKPTGAA